MNESIINVLNILEVEGKCWSWAEMHPNQSLGARSNPTCTLLTQCPEILTHPPWRGGRGGVLRVPALTPQRSYYMGMLYPFKPHMHPQVQGQGGGCVWRTKTIRPQCAQESWPHPSDPNL